MVGACGNLQGASVKCKVTIITIVRNGEKYLERTIRSVVAQTHNDIEYLVIDGASTDGTLAVAERWRDKISYLISEPDAGISDAWNKGLRRASGEIIGLLNAGDEYFPDTVSIACRGLSAGADIVYGDTDLVGDDGELQRRTHGRFHLWKYSGGLGFYHPSVFARRQVYDRIGNFSSRLRYAMDVDWLLRAHAAGLRLHHSAHTVRMLDEGVSVAGRYAAFGESLQALKTNGYPDRMAYLAMMSTGLRGLIRGWVK